MELQYIALAISVANFVLTWGVALYMYLANKNKVTNERITLMETDFDGKLDRHADRLARLEEAVEHAPTHADLSKVYEGLNSLAGTVNQLVGENRGQTDTLRLILSRITERGMP